MPSSSLFQYIFEIVETLIDLKSIIKNQGSWRIITLYVFVDHFTAIFNLILIQLIFSILTFQQSYLGFQLSILFFQTGYNNSRVHSFVS